MKFAITFLGLAVLFLVVLVGGWSMLTSGAVWASLFLTIGSWGFGICIILAIVFFVIKK